jgi:peptidoglycan/xylan/chitin deacetylase (PgdA/CDA1 family)
MRAVPRVFLCVSIDCECDKGPAWKTRVPLRFDGVRTGVVERIHPLVAAHRAKATYLLSPELLRDEASVDVLDALEGCELGAHLHGEMADPGAFVPEVTRDVQRDYPPDVERAKLTSLTSAFRAAFGRAPRSFRAGRFGLGANTVPILEDLGYSVESSVTPGVDWTSVSPGLSFVGAPSQPYHPDPTDPTRPGRSRLLEVPVTTVARVARVARAVARVPFVGRLAEPRWLRPTKTDGAGLVAIARTAVRAALKERPRAPVVLNAMLHNVEVVAGASPYAATEAGAHGILESLGTLLAWARREGIACIGLGDVAEAIGAIDTNGARAEVAG